MDEASASLDAESDRIIQATIRRDMKDATWVMTLMALSQTDSCCFQYSLHRSQTRDVYRLVGWKMHYTHLRAKRRATATRSWSWTKEDLPNMTHRLDCLLIQMESFRACVATAGITKLCCLLLRDQKDEIQYVIVTLVESLILELGKAEFRMIGRTTNMTRVEDWASQI